MAVKIVIDLLFVYAQAGVILEQLDTKLGEVGMMVPLDLGAKAGDDIYSAHPTLLLFILQIAIEAKNLADDILSPLPRAVVI
jgi:hypothetical protein